MTSTASIVSAGEILKQDSLGRVRTPLAKRQEILAAFDGLGVSAARFAAMAGINYSTFSSWVQERNQKQGKESSLTGAAAKPNRSRSGTANLMFVWPWRLEMSPPVPAVVSL